MFKSTRFGFCNRSYLKGCDSSHYLKEQTLSSWGPSKMRKQHCSQILWALQYLLPCNPSKGPLGTWASFLPKACRAFICAVCPADFFNWSSVCTLWKNSSRIKPVRGEKLKSSFSGKSWISFHWEPLPQVPQKTRKGNCLGFSESSPEAALSKLGATNTI